MRFERLTSPNDPRFARAMALYHASFPFHEQREDASQAAALLQADYRFRLIFEDGVFVGLMLCWDTPQFIYVEHFCVEPALRGRGYGQKALALLRAQGVPVILEIDPPVETIAIRRQHFYERAGFVPNGYAHVHPPYHPGLDGHALVVMSAPAALTPAAYEAFRHYLEKTVMGV